MDEGRRGINRTGQKVTQRARPVNEPGAGPTAGRRFIRRGASVVKRLMGNSARKPTTPARGGSGAPARARTSALKVASGRGSRHGLLLSLVLAVALPLAVTGWYLWERAVDQYASVTAFSVREEELGSSLTGLLGGIMNISGGSSRDTDILFEFINSQDLVARIDSQIDLRSIWARPGSGWLAGDPVFAFDPDGSIEDLAFHWSRMVSVDYNSGAGLIEVEVRAFDPLDARRIAELVLEESSRLINTLSTAARADSTRAAVAELARSEERLREAREAMTEFRSRTRIVDPTADIQGQMGLLNTLQSQLASALIDVDLLRETTRANDPRIEQAERRIEVIRRRIEEERSRFSVGGSGPSGEDYATIVAEFERLTVDREFAETAYRAALASYDTALAEAQRQTRYLAAYIQPTLAEEAQYPQRSVLFALSVLTLLMIWGSGAVVYYSIRDRR